MAFTPAEARYFLETVSRGPLSRIAAAAMKLPPRPTDEQAIRAAHAVRDSLNQACVSGSRN